MNYSYIENGLRCGHPQNPNWMKEGCQYRVDYMAGPRGIPCKNGVPYNPNCNIIQKPYSMPYESRNQAPGCPQGAGVWYARAPHFLRDS